MRISIAQTNIRWEDKEVNIGEAEKMIKAAAAESAEMVFFPEMSLTGFSMEVDIIGESDESTLVKFSGLSEKYGIHIGFGWVEYDGIKGRNLFSVVDPGGREIYRYCKIHPFSYAKEDDYFHKGELISTVNIYGTEFSGLICYDLRFPEIFQVASRKAEIITVIANWPAARSEHWKALLKARAIENQSYIIGVNRVGDGSGIGYRGDSCIISPYGETVMDAGSAEGLLTADIDMNLVKKYRDDFKLKNDRREALYGALYGSDRI